MAYLGAGSNRYLWKERAGNKVIKKGGENIYIYTLTYDMMTYDMIFLKCFSVTTCTYILSSSDSTYEWVLRKLNGWPNIYISGHSLQNCLKQHSWTSQYPRTQQLLSSPQVISMLQNSMLIFHPFHTHYKSWSHHFLKLSLLASGTQCSLSSFLTPFASLPFYWFRFIGTT